LKSKLRKEEGKKEGREKGREEKRKETKNGRADQNQLLSEQSSPTVHISALIVV